MMLKASAVQFIKNQDGKNNAILSAVGVAVAVAVFSVDTYTHIEGAVAVLYVIALLLVAEVTTKKGLIAMAAVCIGLSILSYYLTHRSNPDLQSILRIAVAIAALCITAALILRNSEMRATLVKSNAALQESEERYRSIFNLTRVALWERDYSHLRAYLMGLKNSGITDITQYARANPGIVADSIAMIGVVAANEAAIELLGPSAAGGAVGVLTRFISPTSESFTKVLQAIMDGARFYEDKVDLVNERGELKTVLLSMGFPENPLEYSRVVVSMVDVTQREQDRIALALAQAEVARASRATTAGVLSASLAHELNQPLGAVVVNSQTLLRWLDREPPDLAAARRSAERMIRDIQRATDIISNTRSKISNSESQIEAVDISLLVTDTLALMEHELQFEEALVDVVRKTAVPVIQAVRIELQQVLINLITNAIQAMSAAAAPVRRITITLDVPQRLDFVVITIRDTGPGLSPETKEKIFAPFYTTKKSGMGIGLSICRDTLEARGGSLHASNHQAGGAIFEVRLPQAVGAGYS